MAKMDLGSLLRPAPGMSPEELETFRREHPAGSWTLLDVRQPKEYREKHLPGAELIPLPELKERLDEVDRDKPVVAYCAVGGRSRAASQYLQGQGFKEVYNLSGGIKAWDGEVAAGPESWGLELAEPGESPGQAIAAAYGLERGLQACYQGLAQQAAGEQLRTLYQRLAGLEDKHMERLRAALAELPPEQQQGVELKSGGGSLRMEGGWEVSDYLAKHGGQGADPASTVMLAMGLETQAMDLYLRLASRMEQPGSRKVFLALGDEELGHLQALGKMLDEMA
ncbi:MAG: hypothetical protein KQH53_12780 [Desulfarculaceae bacterium]|nr:hypothetical protein [Desulfarculaceae bacterium]